MSLTRVAAIVVLAVLAGASALYLNQPDPLPEGIVSGNGSIEARSIDMAAQIGGRVAEVSVAEGDLVESGQPLAVIDVATLTAQLARAEAAIAAAESAAAAARAGVTQAEAQKRLADTELERARALADRAVVADEQFDIRRTEADVAQAALDAARATLLSQQRAIDAERAAAEEIRTRIADATLAAPRLSRVLYRLAEPGEIVSAGQPIITLVSVADLYMDVFLPATQAPLVRIGDSARIKLDVMPDVAIPARVTFVSPQAQFTPRQVETREERDSLMFRVRVEIPEPLARARIDMVKTGVRGEAWLRLWSPDDTAPDWPADLQVPDAILHEAEDGQG